MARETLKDKNYKIIGYIDTDSTGKQTLKDSTFKVKGYFDPKTNTTRDSTFKMIGKGNLLTRLL
jgi:hypothetical protein